MAANVGGGIEFGGYSSATVASEWAGIKSGKNNGTSGDYGAYMAFMTRSNGSLTAERMRIDSAGNVGIGTTSSGSPLQVNGGAAIGYATNTAAPSNGIAVSGSVGIGTPTPYAPIEAVSSNNSVAFFTSTSALGASSGAGMSGYTFSLPTATGQRLGYLVFGSRAGSWSSAVDNGAAIVGWSNGAWTAGTSYPSYLTFETAASGSTSRTERVRITSAGLMGIGTSSPSYLLHVGSSAASGIVAELQNSAGACTHSPSASAETVTCSSDIRLKSNIKDSENLLPSIDDMKIRDFTIKSTGERKIGVIAQELMVNHPDMVHKNDQDLYSVDEPNPWILVKTIQELHQVVQEQETNINDLKSSKENEIETINALRRDFEDYKEAHP